MKKLITLFAAALLGASAANALVTVTANGNPVKNGETITFYADNFTVEQGVVHTAAAELNFSTNMTQLTISYTSLAWPAFYQLGDLLSPSLWF